MPLAVHLPKAVQRRLQDRPILLLTLLSPHLCLSMPLNLRGQRGRAVGDPRLELPVHEAKLIAGPGQLAVLVDRLVIARDEVIEHPRLVGVDLQDQADPRGGRRVVLDHQSLSLGGRGVRGCRRVVDGVIERREQDVEDLEALLAEAVLPVSKPERQPQRARGLVANPCVGQDFLDAGEQVPIVEGPVKEVVCPCFESPDDLVRIGERGEQNDWQPMERFVCAQRLAEGVAIHLGDVDVRDHEVDGARPRGRERLIAIGRRDHRISRRLEERPHRLQVRLVASDGEDRRRSGCYCRCDKHHIPLERKHLECRAGGGQRLRSRRAPAPRGAPAGRRRLGRRPFPILPGA